MTGREEFEAWFEDHTGWEVDEYPNQDVVSICFDSWQAALASQKPADDDWIEWAACDEEPVDPLTMVEIKIKNGEVLPAEVGSYWDWSSSNIIAYRVVKP